MPRRTVDLRQGFRAYTTPELSLLSARSEVDFFWQPKQTTVKRAGVVTLLFAARANLLIRILLLIGVFVIV